MEKGLQPRTLAGKSTKPLLPRITRHWVLYLLFLPIIAYYIIFRYTPIINSVLIAFKDYKLKLGIWDSPFVGFKHFAEIFKNPDIVRVLRNTVQISLLRILFGFTPPIILAIMFYDMRAKRYKRITQTLVYIPHFFSWVIVFGVVWAFVSEGYGLLNRLTQLLGGKPVNYLMSQKYFRSVIILSAIWKEVGWGTIIYMAALTGIDAELYEAAVIDGAGPLKRIWHISLPGIMPVISFVMCLNLGSILAAGGEQLLTFYNPSVYEVADIIDTWNYRIGVGQLKISLGTAVGMFQSFFGMITLITANKVLRRFVGHGIW